MALHPKIKAMLETGTGVPEVHTLPIQTARDNLARTNSVLQRPVVFAADDRTIPGPRGGLKVRIYRHDSVEPRPVVLFFHGGGFALGDLDTHDGLARQICVRSDAIVVSVDYALAPENKFPAALDDCLAATLWVARKAPTFGGDATRIALAGDSAGGNLAAALAIRIRDESGPDIAAQLLIYPVTDHYTAGMPSYAERGTGYGLSGDAMTYFWDLYLSDPSDAGSPYASPNRLQDLKDLPPAYIVTAEYDPLRDEGRAFAQRLSDAGVETTYVNYPDVNHAFAKWAGHVDRADEALDSACAWLRQVL